MGVRAASQMKTSRIGASFPRRFSAVELYLEHDAKKGQPPFGMKLMLQRSI
jgi:hypothetical protein